MDPIDFIPPHHFPALDPGQMFSSEREGKIFDEAKFSLTTGYPYDVIEDIPTTGDEIIPETTKARGGAVHFSHSGPPGNTFPEIDRGFFFEVLENKVETKSFFGADSRVYLSTKVTEDESSLWGYSETGTEQFVLKAKAEETMLWLRSGDASVTLDIPDNNGTLLDATWQEIDICVNGESKKMKVLGTFPYDA